MNKPKAIVLIFFMMVCFLGRSQNHIKMYFKSSDYIITDKKAKAGLEFGVEYSTGKLKTKSGSYFNRVISKYTLYKIGFKVDGKVYTQKKESSKFQLDIDTYHKCNGKIPIEYHHPKNSSLLIRDTVHLPYPQKINLGIDIISFSEEKEMKLSVEFDNGLSRFYEKKDILTFLEAYNYEASAVNASIIHDRDTLSYGRLGGRIESLPGLILVGVVNTTMLAKEKIDEKKSFRIILKAEDFKHDRLGDSIKVLFNTSNSQLSSTMLISTSGKYNIKYFGEDADAFSIDGPGEYGEDGPNLLVHVEKYSDSLFLVSIKKDSSNESFYLLDPKRSQIKISSIGGKGGRGENGDFNWDNEYSRGGSGFSGGDGGGGGDISITYEKEFIPYLSIFRAYSRGGKPGNGGSGGPGSSSEGIDGRSGSNGRRGKVNFKMIDSGYLTTKQKYYTEVISVSKSQKDFLAITDKDLTHEFSGFKVEPMDSSWYKSLENMYDDPIKMDSGQVTWTSSSFSLNLNDGTYKSYKSDLDEVNYFQGFYKDLNVFQIRSSLDNGNYFITAFVDSKDGKTYVFDTGIYSQMNLELNPNGVIIAICGYNSEKNESNISLFKCSRDTGSGLNVNYLNTLSLKESFISNLSWISNDTFCIESKSNQEVSVDHEIKFDYLMIRCDMINR